MKTLGLIIVLSVGVLAMLLAVLPIGTSLSVHIYPDKTQTELGLLRIGEIQVSNSGIFTRAVRLPEFVACAGDTEVPIDTYVSTDGSVVPGVGQLQMISVRPGESGTVYLVAHDTGYGDHLVVYHRTSNFGCLTATNPLN